MNSNSRTRKGPAVLFNSSIYLLMSNPASRLHAILLRSKDEQLRNKNVMVAWRTVLELPKELDDLVTMSKVGKLFTLPSIISDQIRRFPDIDADLCLGWR
jgi:hypothetical protein